MLDGSADSPGAATGKTILMSHAMTTETASLAPTGPSFTAALCGFLSTTVATTMLMFLLSSL